MLPLSAIIKEPERAIASPLGALKWAFEPTPSTGIAALSTVFVTEYSPAKRVTRPLGEIARMRWSLPPKKSVCDTYTVPSGATATPHGAFNPASVPWPSTVE